MIRYDRDAMETLETRDFDIVIPFELHVPSDGEPRVTCVRGLSAFARRFLSEHDGDYFSKDAIRSIRQKATDYILPFGYCEDPASRTFIYDFVSDPEREGYKEILRTDSTRITEDVTGNRTTFPVRKLIREGHLVTGTVVDGVIVSIAATHAPILDVAVPVDSLVEIGTETAPEHRGKGYASSNVALLARLLGSLGFRVLYCCTDRNKKSCRIAEKAGFIMESRRYSYVGRRS